MKNLTLSCLTVLVVTLLAGVNAHAQQQAGYDWTLTVRTDQYNDYLRFTGTQLNRLAKLKVDCGKTAATAVPYEQFWFHCSAPLGCEKQSDSPFHRNDSVCIEIPAGSHVDSDQRAAESDVIARLWLDAALKHAQLKDVFVADSDFDGLVDALNASGFTAPSPASGNPAVQLYLYSMPPGRFQSLIYQR